MKNKNWFVSIGKDEKNKNKTRVARAFLSIYPAKRAKFFNSKQPSKQLTDVFSGTKNEDELNQQQMKGDRENGGRARARRKWKRKMPSEREREREIRTKQMERKEEFKCKLKKKK